MTKTDLTRPDPFELVNISVRLYKVQRDLIDRASALWGEARPDTSLSDYIREVLTERAAADLGVAAPVVPDIQRGRGNSLIRQAAAKLGMTVEAFELAAVRMAASQALGADALDNRPSRSGTYSRQSSPPEAITRPKRVTGK